MICKIRDSKRCGFGLEKSARIKPYPCFDRETTCSVTLRNGMQTNIGSSIDTRFDLRHKEFLQKSSADANRPCQGGLSVFMKLPPTFAAVHFFICARFQSASSLLARLRDLPVLGVGHACSGHDFFRNLQQVTSSAKRLTPDFCLSPATFLTMSACLRGLSM